MYFRGMQSLLVLLSVFRMVVLPVQFEDRELATARAQQEELVQQAQAYFDRQFAGSGTTFRFELAPAVTLQQKAAWYGANYPDRKDVRIGEAVREACMQAQGKVDFAACDRDADGKVDNVFLLFAGPGEHESGVEDDLYPQQGFLSDAGGTFTVGGKTVDSYAAAPEGRLGVFCHEFAHALGLPDLYDMDGADSGGTARGLWGTSLMDEGCRRDVPPDFGALEYELLGLGSCKMLTRGPQVLLPLAEGHSYLKAATDQEGEFFLFEARGDGLYVYHIDRSDNPAGASQRQTGELTARGRWESGEINNNPDHPCARLVPADPAATDAAGLPFAGGAGFSSDTPAAFRSWDGSAQGMALTGIRLQEDGSIAFEVLQPLTVAGITVYQDAAVVNWTPDPALDGIQGFEIRWTDGGRTDRRELSAQATGCTLEGLRPKTDYTFSIQLRLAGGERYSADGTFTTKVRHQGTYPYIYLNSATRNVDGTFPPGSKLPLRVFNATDVQEVRWSLDGIPLVPEADGGFTLQRGGMLRARILHTDGTSETLVKEIIVQ